MFSKRLKRLFVTDDDVKDDTVKADDVKPNRVKSNEVEVNGIRKRFCFKYGTGSYEYTYQEKLDGLVPCRCGESHTEGWRCDIKLLAVHTESDHVDGRCIKCADKSDNEECFDYSQGRLMSIVYPDKDILKHTNLVELTTNLDAYSRFRCLCGKERSVVHNEIRYDPDSGIKDCCRKSIELFNVKYKAAILNKRKQEWESKHGKLNHED